MAKNNKIQVEGLETVLYENNQQDYISLTDIARHKDADHTDTIIQNWMRNRNTIELLGFWETIITAILNPLNSRGLENKQVSTVL